MYSIVNNASRLGELNQAVFGGGEGNRTPVQHTFISKVSES